MGDLARAAGHSGRLDGRADGVDTARSAQPVHRDRHVQRPGQGTRPHATLDGSQPGSVLDVGEPADPHLQRAMRTEAKETVAMSKFAAMKPRLPRLTRALFVLVMISAGLVAASSTASSAAPVAIALCAEPGNATLVGSVSVPIWGFHTGACGSAAATLPGPQLVVNEGDTVTVNITNGLPAGHTLTFEIPGITFDAGPTDIAAGTSGAVSFTAGAP